MGHPALSGVRCQLSVRLLVGRCLLDEEAEGDWLCGAPFPREVVPLEPAVDHLPGAADGLHMLHGLASGVRLSAVVDQFVEVLIGRRSLHVSLPR
jgi:hypothetical protein